MSADRIAHEIRTMGARFDPQILQRTRGLYLYPVRQAPWAGRTRLADLVYGEAPRHRLDLYPPDVPHAPVLLFVHGGGFVAGDKAADEVFYANVGRYFAASGFLAVTMNYRLADTAPWPAGSEDVRGALDWIIRCAALYDGDPTRIVLLGQSAGATHIADLLFHPRYETAVVKSVRGAMLMSGFYRAVAPLKGGSKAYFGDDPASYAQRSAIAHIRPGHPPLLLSVAEFDPPEIAAQTLQLALALNTADGRPPRQLWFEGHNHVSTIHSLGVGADEVGQALCEFAVRATASGG